MKRGYVPDEALSTVVFLASSLEKPLLLEGRAGVGKTEVASVLASTLGTELVRLQCYEGLDSNAALYEWNYQKQIMALKAHEGDPGAIEARIFGPEFLLERPLLRSIRSRSGPVVLLIDEIDRADEEFEAFLLELLSEYQVSIPELGTIRAEFVPHVILTSNKTRELSDALKRRCLYHWMDYPDRERELAIVRAKLPEAGRDLAVSAVDGVREMRSLELSRYPGVSETVDWVRSLSALGLEKVDEEGMRRTIGCVVKDPEDMERVLSRKGGA